MNTMMISISSFGVQIYLAHSSPREQNVGCGLPHHAGCAGGLPS